MIKKEYYQYLIYNNDQFNEIDDENGVIIETSDLYLDEECCKKDAQEKCDELNKDFDSDNQFDFEVQSLVIVDFMSI